MGGTMEKQTLEKYHEQPEINGKTGNKNNKNKKEKIENQSTKSLVKAEGKSQHKRNGVSKKRKMIRYQFLQKIKMLI